LFKKVLVCTFAALYALPIANAQQAAEDFKISDNMNISDFIEKAYTPTFDCPTAALNDKVDSALELASLTPAQALQLTSMKSHGLICAGQHPIAEGLLQRLLANENADRSAHYYLSAIFQYGFIYDLKENPERCDYFMLARDSAKGKYPDVHLSASLGFTTECISDLSEQVYGLSQILEMTTDMDDPAALAHTYNRVAQFYSSHNRGRLAAAQYLKAYETGKGFYTQDNLLSILGGVITGYTGAGDLPAVKAALDKFVALNKDIQTPRTQYLQYYFEARYYTSVEDFKKLEEILINWKDVAEKDTNPVYQGFYRWYTAALCLNKEDMACLESFIEVENKAPDTYLKYANTSSQYLELIIKVQLVLGNRMATEEAFAAYVKVMKRQKRKLEDNSAILDVIRLNDKIINLESSLAEQEEKRSKMIWILMFVVILVLLIALWFLRRKYIESKSYDSATGLLNNTAVINKLMHLPKPSQKCTNALAIFDIANFMEVNLTLGSTKSDFVLLQIANTLKKITRSSDLLGRFGPEQFILCLVDIEEDAAQAFFERAKEALTNTFADQNSQYAINVDSSMSIFYSTETFTDIDEILKNMLLSLSMKADQA